MGQQAARAEKKTYHSRHGTEELLVRCEAVNEAGVPMDSGSFNEGIRDELGLTKAVQEGILKDDVLDDRGVGTMECGLHWGLLRADVQRTTAGREYKDERLCRRVTDEVDENSTRSVVVIVIIVIIGAGCNVHILRVIVMRWERRGVRNDRHGHGYWHDREGVMGC